MVGPLNPLPLFFFGVRDDTDTQQFEDLLVTNGIDPNSKEQINNARTYFKETLLQSAITINNMVIVKYLLQHGAEINQLGNCGTALSTACAHSKIEIARYLIESGADVNSVHTISLSGGKTINRSALCSTAIAGNQAIATLLIDNDADIDGVYSMKPAYETALETCHKEVGEYIAAAGKPRSLVWQAAKALSAKDADQAIAWNIDISQIVFRAKEYNKLLKNYPSYQLLHSSSLADQSLD